MKLTKQIILYDKESNTIVLMEFLPEQYLPQDTGNIIVLGEL